MESALRNALCEAIGIEREIGRIVFGTPRVEEFLTRIKQVAETREYDIKFDFKGVSREALKIEKFRDKVAHGVWVKHKRSKLPVLQVTSGNYQVPQRLRCIHARGQHNYPTN